MNWSDLTKTLPNVAKVLTSGLPFSGAISVGIDAISSLLGIDANDPIKLTEALQNATPAQQIELKKIDATIFAKELEDRQNARQMQIENIRSGRPDNVPKVLSYLSVISFVVLGMMFVFHNNDTVDLTIIKEMIITNGAILMMVFSFWFGNAHKH